ncbi:MAG: peptidase T [Firmicutes bacterium]|nr:peptidase T [Bacillota bacterium]
MTREQLLTEGLLAKFLRYVQIDSPSLPGQATTPSTKEQWVIAEQLCNELKTLGLEDAKVDEHGFVTATLPGNVTGCPVVGFLAHMDTVPGVPGHGVRPIVHENYDGGDIQLPSGDVLSPEAFPLLLKAKGHTIITSDGTTLLGADDKAGVAAIMEAICHLLQHPEIEHGPIKVAFTPDEEIATGIAHFDVESFGADLGYTIDGGSYGTMQDETFNADNYIVTIHGVSAHTGTARNAMINAVHLAGEFVGAVPATMRPETTDGMLGFIHPDTIQGDVERVEIKIYARDFTREGLAAKGEILRGLGEDLMRRYPGSKFEMKRVSGYRNMREVLKEYPKIVQIAQEAIRQTGIEPIMEQVRGGTDGSQLTFMGLPSPNLFYGGSNAHSRLEWASLQWMEKAADMIINIAQLWAKETSI